MYLLTQHTERFSRKKGNRSDTLSFYHDRCAFCLVGMAPETSISALSDLITGMVTNGSSLSWLIIDTQDRVAAPDPGWADSGRNALPWHICNPGET